MRMSHISIREKQHSCGLICMPRGLITWKGIRKSKISDNIVNMASAMLGVKFRREELPNLSWRSFVLPMSNNRTLIDNVETKLQLTGQPYLIFEHKVGEGPVEETHALFRRDHYHVLHANGNRKTGSDPVYSYIKRQIDRLDERFTCEQVRSFDHLIS